MLICGETGSGKELIARALHNSGPRKQRPLVKVNCGAVPAALLESELFGHVKGAFTGAIERRVGRFELADGGTLFLDEVGELPLETQVKLLRVLQEQEFEPVGSSQTMRVDVRIIAATNRDLNDEVRAGRFRADLFFRLNVVPLTVPPLRERPSDIPMLVTYFVSRFAKKFGRKIDGVARDTMDRLTAIPVARQHPRAAEHRRTRRRDGAGPAAVARRRHPAVRPSGAPLRSRRAELRSDAEPAAAPCR